MNRAKRIIRRHVAEDTLFDCIIWIFALVAFTASTIRTSLELDYSNLSGAGWIVPGVIAFIDILVSVCIIIRIIRSFRSWLKIPEQATTYEHLLTASASELEANIDRLDSSRRRAKLNLSNLYIQRSRLQSEYGGKLAVLDEQIEAQQKAIADAKYDSEINLLKQLIRAQRRPRFFHRKTNVQ